METLDNQPYTARLNNWASVGKGLAGQVYSDKNKRFSDGTIIYTSTVVSGKQEEGQIITTSNSTYLLGKPNKQE